MPSIRATFRDQSNGDIYRVRFEWIPWWRAFATGQPAHYQMFVEQRPECRLALGMAAHLRPGERICVLEGFEPRTLSRAKAITLLWLSGFGVYRRTGEFPNDGGRVNVAEG